MVLKDYVNNILSEVRSEGKSAVKKYSNEFDDYRGPLKVQKEEIDRGEEIPEEDKQIIEEVVGRVKNYHERQSPDDCLFSQEGSIYGTFYRPIKKVGVYVPGGRPLVSSLIMTAVPARIAEVDKIVMATPPTGDHINPHLSFTARLLEIDDIYKLGGAQAIGALAYGAGPPSVDKIFGPGNKYVNEAKRQVYGEVGIDSLAGPSEICIIADSTAKKEIVLSDLQSQLEHGEGARAWLFTTSSELGNYCNSGEIEVEVLEDLKKCISRANEVAPEHLEIITANPTLLLDNIENAGAVYLGEFTPAAAGDYFLGVNHVLPTGGAARFDSVLTVGDFLKPISLAYTSSEEYKKHCYLGKRLSEIEGMTEHRKSLEVRENEKRDR